MKTYGIRCARAATRYVYLTKQNTSLAAIPHPFLPSLRLHQAWRTDLLRQLRADVPFALPGPAENGSTKRPVVLSEVRQAPQVQDVQEARREGESYHLLRLLE
jgi:hypothetical protein